MSSSDTAVHNKKPGMREHAGYALLIVILVIGQFLIGPAIMIIVPVRGIVHATPLPGQADGLDIGLAGIVGGRVIIIANSISISITGRGLNQAGNPVGQVIGRRGR